MKNTLIISFLLITNINIMGQQIMEQQQITRKDLLNAVINHSVSVVEIKEITMPKGQVAPKHLHPCSVVGYISSGSVLFQIEGEKKQILKKGDAFYEPKNKVILHFDNASNKEPITFIAFYLKDDNEKLIEIVD